MTYTKNLLRYRAVVLLLTGVLLSVVSTRVTSQTGCSPNPTPFTDLGQMPTVFCQAVAAVYFTGITSGTTATTYSPATNVTRDQMAAFLSRTHDSALRRGSRRAAIGKWWIASEIFHTFVTLDSRDTLPRLVYHDGGHLWVAWSGSATVSRLNPYKGEGEIFRWTGAADAYGIFSNGHHAYITGFTNPGRLYLALTSSLFVTTLSTDLPPFPAGIASDGSNLWTANFGTGPNTGSITRLGNGTTTFPGFNRPAGILFDGANLWVTDGDGINPSTLKRVNPATGQVTLTVTQNLGVGPAFPVFDGTNIWVPNFTSDSITVVRAVGGLAGTPLAVLEGNGLAGPVAGAFDGERILFTNYDNTTGTSVSLWKAADLSVLGTIQFAQGHNRRAWGACSDGTYFYISAREGSGSQLLRL